MDPQDDDKGRVSLHSDQNDLSRTPDASTIGDQNGKKKRKWCCIASYTVIALILFILLLGASIIVIVFTVKQTQKGSTYYYVLLPANATCKWGIDSRKYEGAEFQFSNDQDKQYTLLITPTSEKIEQSETRQYITHIERDVYTNSRDSFMVRYWPKDLAINGHIQCQTISGESTILVWKWSSIYTSKDKEIDNSIDCSEVNKYSSPYVHVCPSSPELVSVNVISLLDSRGNYDTMSLGVCSNGENAAKVKLIANFTEEQYKTDSYPHYSMGYDTNNPDSITVPLTDRKAQTNFYVKVSQSGVNQQPGNVEIFVSPISYPEDKERYYWSIGYATITATVSVIILLMSISVVVYLYYKL